MQLSAPERVTIGIETIHETHVSRYCFPRGYYRPFWRQTHLYNTANFGANKIEMWKAVRIQPSMPRLSL